jgi:geranylgeranyl reductase family protein
MGIKLNRMYDVVTIGAGPVGIYTSIKLAQHGLQTLVIEEDAQIGKPRFCTGLISKEAFNRFDLPKEAIEAEFDSAWVFSPLGSKLCLKTRDIQVYVTDRTKFDQGLYNRAKEKGVEFLLACQCTGFSIDNNHIETQISYDGITTTVKSQVVILATGIKYNLHRAIGLTPPLNFLDCSQIQLPGKSDGNIEIFLGNSIAPHSFVWVVPLNKKRLRLGISTLKNSPSYLKSFLKYLRLKGRISKENPDDIIRRPIPLEPMKNSYTSRVLVVGDAAGQVKPTTGGGIYFGLLCADLAAKTIIEAFRKSDFSKKFLRHYEINWKKEIEFDLVMSIYLRKLIANFNDEQIEKLVRFCAQDSIQRLIEEYADFNHHGKFIKELIMNPAFWKNLYQILTIN